jgi:drug/metabolite transporter (DMT)-like permease
MSWILIAIVAYLILAVVNLADKFLLDKILPSTKTYTFLVGVLGLIAFCLAPWFLEWPGIFQLFLNLMIGAVFPVTLLLLYKALKDGDASSVITLIGGSMPIITLILSILFLGESFSGRQWIAIGFLLIGTIVISWIPKDKKTLLDTIKEWLKFSKKKQRNHGTMIAIGAALGFAVFFTGSKYLYDTQTFLSAFIWIRLGTFLAVLFLLIKKDARKEIFTSIKSLKGKKGVLFFGNQGIASIGAFLQNYAISLGSVALVSAIQGVQYAFLLIIGGLITVLYPKIVKENISKSVVIQKVMAIVLISIGLYFITT